MRGLTEVFEALSEELEAWCKRQGLPFMSADELYAEVHAPHQRAWLSDFIKRWEEAEQAERDLLMA